MHMTESDMICQETQPLCKYMGRLRLNNWSQCSTVGRQEALPPAAQLAFFSSLRDRSYPGWTSADLPAFALIVMSVFCAGRRFPASLQPNEHDHVRLTFQLPISETLVFGTKFSTSRFRSLLLPFDGKTTTDHISILKNPSISL